ncbi:MAG: preprotein translocase subunit SecG [Flavobacteriales bacterium]|nr:preprotein translocase subunit SecG [Flavobacteriales bacterium]
MEVLNILIIICCLLLVMIILAQNPKGGGLSSTFGGGGNQMMGVQKTTDFLEKATWILIVALISMIILYNVSCEDCTTSQITFFITEKQSHI